MRGKNLKGATGLLALSLLSGCVKYDPLYREGLWHPMHVNRPDLVVMVANPADLVHGSGASTSNGQLAAAAVDRLRNDKVKKLPDAGLSEIRVQSQGSNGN